MIWGKMFVCQWDDYHCNSLFHMELTTKICNNFIILISLSCICAVLLWLLCLLLGLLLLYLFYSRSISIYHFHSFSQFPYFISYSLWFPIPLGLYILCVFTFGLCSTCIWPTFFIIYYASRCLTSKISCWLFHLLFQYSYQKSIVCINDNIHICTVYFLCNIIHRLLLMNHLYCFDPKYFIRCIPSGYSFWNVSICFISYCTFLFIWLIFV